MRPHGAVGAGADALRPARAIQQTRALYFLTSYPLTSWFSETSEVHDRFTVDDGTWGVLLMTAPAVTLVTARAYPRLVPRRLAHRALGLALACITVAVFGIGLCRTVPLLAGLLVLIGVANAVLQVEGNSRAHLVESLTGRRVFASCHGCYSLGVLAAGLTAYLVSAWQLPIVVHFWAVLLVGAAGLLMLRLRPLDEPVGDLSADGADAAPADPVGVRFSMPVLMALSFVLLAMEAAVNAWHGTLVDEGLGFDGYSGAVYAAYALGGIVIRFTGDQVRARWGTLAAFVVAGPLASLLLFAALAGGQRVVVLAAFLVLGVAQGIAYPDVLKLAAEGKPTETASRVARVVTAGTVGVLLANPLMGWLSDRFSVVAAYAGLSLLLLGTACYTAVRYALARRA
ncbi:MFS transporter [Streptomyces sp. NPDC008343]|uniref:MFS transporter n=1 Tax=Streptomyces sp. NPDC008343 TaxID=3364828 RepID=UPI0036EE0647